MKILLIGEYSNVHATLAAALRRAGHDVLVVSDGDGWKDYPRDVDISRRADTRWETLRLMARLTALLPRLRGFDVVQVINPYFVYLSPERNLWLWHYLRRSGCVMSLACMGDDCQVLSRQADVLAYSDAPARRSTALWTEERRALCQQIAAEADCLVAGLYEYWKCYDTPAYRDRLHYIALPIDVSAAPREERHGAADAGRPVEVLVGIQRRRSDLKGIGEMLPLLRQVASEHPTRLRLTEVEDVPFAQYQQLTRRADVLVDQLYSYTPAMNALLAMSQGTVVVSGGEEEYYSFIGEPTLRPVINLRPDAPEANLATLRASLPDRAVLARLSQEGRQLVARHHDADMVARQYVSLWQSLRH